LATTDISFDVKIQSSPFSRFKVGTKVYGDLSIAAYKFLGVRPFERMYTSLAEGFHTVSYFAGPMPSKLNICSSMMTYKQLMGYQVNPSIKLSC